MTTVDVLHKQEWTVFWEVTHVSSTRCERWSPALIAHSKGVLRDMLILKAQSPVDGQKPLTK